MKKFLKLVVMFSVCHSVALAQWTPAESVDGNIHRNGNVGIGVTSPAYKLDIQNVSGEPDSFVRIRANDSSSDYFSIINTTGASGQFIPRLMGYHETDNRASIQLVGATSALNDVGTNALVNFDARILDAPIVNRPLFSWTSYSTPKMTMLANGFLGIGTANPLYRLDVSSGARIRRMEISTIPATAANSWVRDTWLTSNMGNVTWDETTAVWRRPAGTYNDFGGIIWQDEGTYFIRERAGSQVEFSNSEFLNKAFLFANIATGNVGIGTNAPDAKLTVKGTIHTQEVKVDLNGSVAPDFVFEEDYALPALAETEAYIKSNKHLPGIPSAAEMEENGIDLKEMNLKLLQKVEELTLHLIEQEKKNEELTQRVEALEKEKN